MSTELFDGFRVRTQLEDDGLWTAYLDDMRGVSAHGETSDEAVNELKVAFGLVKKDYKKRGVELPIPLARKAFSGSFNVRVDKRLHKALVFEAHSAGVSLNHLVAQRLTIASPVHMYA
jgi:predicted HicB family RNase H-like nuclease